MEPYRLRRWRLPSVDHIFYTCARPGRSKGNREPVPDKLIHDWISGLPASDNVVVVSLLGQKPDGTSEFSFYSFHKKRQTFQKWLDENSKAKTVTVIEHPTWDFHPVPCETCEAVETDICRLISEGRIVVLIDSGGEQRTGQVCKYMGAVEDSARSGG